MPKPNLPPKPLLSTNPKKTEIIENFWLEFLQWSVVQKYATVGMKALYSVEDLDNPDVPFNKDEWRAAPTEQNFWVWYQIYKLEHL